MPMPARCRATRPAISPLSGNWVDSSCAIPKRENNRGLTQELDWESAANDLESVATALYAVADEDDAWSGCVTRVLTGHAYLLAGPVMLDKIGEYRAEAHPTIFVHVGNIAKA